MTELYTSTSKTTDRMRLKLYGVLVLILISQFMSNGFALSNKTKPRSLLNEGLMGYYFADADCSNLVLIRPENNDSRFNLEFLNNSRFEKYKTQIRCAEWHGKITPHRFGDFFFSTTDNESIQLWVNGMLLIDQGDSKNADNRIYLDKNQSYTLKLRYQNSKRIPNFKLKWKQGSGRFKLIPKMNLSPKKKLGGIQKKQQHSILIDIWHQLESLLLPELGYAETGCVIGGEYDDDCDGITDTFETTGYNYQSGIGFYLVLPFTHKWHTPRLSTSECITFTY